MKFRKGIGSIILDKNDNVISFKTMEDPKIWESPEGGIDGEESPIETLYRELKEEINLDMKDYDVVAETKDFIPYLHDYWKQFGLDGQEKKFYLVKLKVDKNFKFDNVKDVEFTEYKITEPQELLLEVSEYKKEMYRRVLKEFKLVD